MKKQRLRSHINCSFAVILGALLCGALSSGCNPLTAPKASELEAIKQSYEGRDKRSFYAYNFDTGTYYQTSAVLLAAGEDGKCAVYGEISAYVSVETALLIIEEFEQRILPLITGAFDPDMLLDGMDGPVILLLLDIRDGYHPQISYTYINGFFHYPDLYPPQTGTLYANSNNAKMLYLDTSPQSPGSPAFYSTAAHELQHMINHLYAQRRNKQQELWIDEGLSSAAEYLYSGKHLQTHIDHFNQDPYGTLRRGNTFLYWEDESNFVFDEYATVYLFFQWLRIHAPNGAAIYRDIISSRDADYRAITGAAERIDPRFSSWETLLKTWFLANYVNYPDKDGAGGLGFLGYNREFGLTPKTVTGLSILLRPGEGVFSAIGTSFRPQAASDAPFIRYAGISKSGAESEWLGESLQGDRLLTFNANPNPKGRQEAGNLTGIGDSRSAGRTAGEAVRPMPVDRMPIPRDRFPAQ